MKMKKIILFGIVLTISVILGIVIINRVNNINTQNLITQQTNTSTTFEEEERINNNVNNENIEEMEYIEENEIAGYIQISKTNLDIPIFSKATTDSLTESVAIMYGKGLNNVGNTVIMGIDFFKDNNKLSIGDIIYITDQNKNKVMYKIYDIQKLKAKDTSYYERNTNGKKEITLVSYIPNLANNRLVILAQQT